MNLKVNSQRLAAELRLLNKIVPSKPAIAILSHALFRADESGLHLSATDLEVMLSTDCQASVTTPGRVALPVARFLQLVEQFTDDDVEIVAESNKVNVACGAFKSRLQAMPVDDYPQPPSVDGDVNILDGDSFRRMIGRTRYAINATAQKYILQGALLTLAGDAAAMVTTDGKRLALTTASRKGTDISMVIPIKALDVLAGSDGDIEVTAGPRHLQFAYSGRTLMSRTIDGKFPAYDRIIPRDNSLTVAIGRHDLTSALKRVIVASEDNRAIYCSISTNAITLRAQSQEVGQAVEDVKAQYDGLELKVCVNGSFMLDFLEAASGGSIQLHLKDANSAMILTDGDDSVGVIMLLKG